MQQSQQFPLIFYPGQPLAQNYLQHFTCFKCQLQSPQLQCSNCPKMFHLNCSLKKQNVLRSNNSVHEVKQNCIGISNLEKKINFGKNNQIRLLDQDLNQLLWVCQDCQMRSRHLCKGCRLEIYQSYQECENYEFEKSTERQQQVCICTLCCSLFHSQCAQLVSIILPQIFQFFKPNFAFVCKNCLDTNQISHTIQSRYMFNNLYFFIQACKKSPIHRTWVNQQMYQKLAAIQNTKEKEKRNEKLKRASICVQSEVRNCQNQNLNKNQIRQQQANDDDDDIDIDVNIMKAEKILAVKIPLIGKQWSIGYVLGELWGKVAGLGYRDYGDSHNFYFLIKWKSTKTVSWQDQNIALAFPFELCMFLALLQSESYKKPYLSTLINNLQQTPNPPNLPQSSSALHQIHTPIIDHLSTLIMSPMNQSSPTALFIRFIQKTSSKLSQELMCSLISSLQQKHNQIYRTLIICNKQDIDNWMDAAAVSWVYRQRVQVRRNKKNKLGEGFEIGGKGKRRFGIVVMQYRTFVQSWGRFTEPDQDPICIIMDKFNSSQLGRKVVMTLKNLNRKNILLFSASGLVHDVIQIVQFLDEEYPNLKVTNLKSLQKMFSVNSQQKKSTALELPNANINQIQLLFTHPPNLLLDSFNNAANHNIVSLPGLTPSPDTTPNQVPSPNSTHTYPIPTLHRQLFHIYILNKGLSQLQTCPISHQLAQYKPNYSKQIESLPQQKYQQYLQIYLSCLKDYQKYGTIDNDMLKQMLFNLQPEYVYARICQIQRMRNGSQV